MFEVFKKKPGMVEMLDKASETTAEPSEKPEQSYKSRIQRRQDVLDYLKTREGEITRETDIAEALDISLSYTNLLVKELLSKKTITRKGKRSRYIFKVNRQSVRRGRPANHQEEPSLGSAVEVPHISQEKVAALDTLEELVLEYVKETRCTDVLHFLTWMEQREISKVEE
jgi:hypothetical protein